MAYDFDEIIAKIGGKSKVKYLVEEEAYTYSMLLEVLGMSQGTSRTITKKLIEYCNTVVPFPKTSNHLSRKWMVYWLKYGVSYWDNSFLVDQIFDKLTNPILNITGSTKRYHISMWGHPNANKDSYQVKAHQIVWELNNECFLPEGSEIEAIDRNFLNLDIANLRVRTRVDRLSFYSSGERNYFYTGTPRYTNYSRGWSRLSKAYRDKVGCCEVCNTKSARLNAHHLISYWLFPDNDTRVHSEHNLLCVCDSCHANIHQHNTKIVPHISVTKYTKLLELLESLKSQVPDTLMETYKDVEKQLGLTDNQQLST